MYSGLDIGKYVGVIFVDLKKAFDTVDHQTPIQKLAHYGIRSSELVLLKSYLSNRPNLQELMDFEGQNVGIGVPKAHVLVLCYFYFTSMIFLKPQTTPKSTCLQMIPVQSGGSARRYTNATNNSISLLFSAERDET